MIRAIIAFLALTAVAVSACAGTAAESTPPPSTRSASVTLVLNAAVYTLDPGRPWAEAFAFNSAGVIIAVGSEEDVRAEAGEDPKIIDAGGNMVLPGFQDTHVHVPEAGINESLCFMESGLELSDYASLAADCAREQPGDGWVRAAGPSLFELRDTDESPLEVLDRSVPNRPMLVLDDLGHAVWTNTLGLEAAGIGPSDPDPQGGIFHRDRDGQLTGLLLEDAQQLVRNAAAPDDDTIYQGLLTSFAILARNGVTTVSDAGGYWQQRHPAAWERALDEGALTVRGVNGLYVYPDLEIEGQLAEFERRFRDQANRLLRFNTAKIYVDGILDMGTAALIDPYDVPIDPAYPTGFNYFGPDQLQIYVSELSAMGYRMNFHVIGDAATRSALDAVEAIPDDPEAIRDRRHRTTHTYLVDPNDIERFEQLGVVADFQVGPDSTDPDYHEFLSEFIGDRALHLLPVEALLDANASVSLSSDWDADPLSPFGIIERSILRQTNAVPDVQTAIELVTIDAAYALGHDDTTGSIALGKFADFVIVDQHLLDIEVSAIADTNVLLTVLAGNEVYRSPQFD